LPLSRPFAISFWRSTYCFLLASLLLFPLLFPLLFLLLFVVFRLRRSSRWNSRVQESVEDCGSKRRTVVYITPFLSLPFFPSDHQSDQYTRAFCEYSSSCLSSTKYPHGPLSPPLRPKTHSVQQLCYPRSREEVPFLAPL
jgi:hypothetical protein